MHCRTLIFVLMAWSTSASVIKPDASLAERADDLECDRDHAPNPSDCQTLLNRVISNQDQHNLQQGPRNMNWGSCYVSWSNYVVGSAQELVPHMSRMINTCMGGSWQSGIIKNVNILGQSQSTAICLSNRASGCEN
ncbi:hypothetical protein NQ176_g6641 [Zarea fungicola]|uniref:Uncharacterized protein n=1 Tax=Zarea fungicola TaxID=93591 RepID=A0ACC1N4K6_9HYPO|nr:hypothetical protein NQ176_g6641 [Lecanicillium fungicola]